MTRGGAVILAALLGLGAAAAGFLLARQQPAVSPGSGPAPAARADVIGQARPAFSLPDLEGVEHHVSEWDGSILVINFWATWCPPCRTEIPAFMTLQSGYAGQGVQFLGIALEAAEPVRRFAAELGINYPLLAGEMPVIGIATAYGNDVGALPYTVVVDRQGHIRFAHAGPLSREKAEAVIRSLL